MNENDKNSNNNDGHIQISIILHCASNFVDGINGKPHNEPVRADDNMPQLLVALNINTHSGVDFEGSDEMCKPVAINKSKLLPIELQAYDEGFENYAFNAYVSNLISVHRILLDVHVPTCQTSNYNTLSVTASIVMCFHKEA